VPWPGSLQAEQGWACQLSCCIPLFSWDRFEASPAPKKPSASAVQPTCSTRRGAQCHAPERGPPELSLHLCQVLPVPGRDRSTRVCCCRGCFQEGGCLRTVQLHQNAYSSAGQASREVTPGSSLFFSKYSSSAAASLRDPLSPRAAGAGCCSGAGSGGEGLSWGSISGGDGGSSWSGGSILPVLSLYPGAAVAALGWIRGRGGLTPLAPTARFLNGSFWVGSALHSGVLVSVPLSLEKGVTDGVLYFHFT